jgi:hypothetical protein
MHSFYEFSIKPLSERLYKVTAKGVNGEEQHFDSVSLYEDFEDLTQMTKNEAISLLSYDFSKVALYIKDQEGNLHLLSEDVARE